MLRKALLFATAITLLAGYATNAGAQDYKPDPKVLTAISKSKVTLAQGLASVKSPAVPISAKFELEDKPGGKLSLSIYVATLGLRNPAKAALKEISGSPETAPWNPEVGTLSGSGDIAAANDQIKLLAKTHVTLAQVVRRAQSEVKGTIVSIAPVSESGHAKFAVFVASGGTAHEIDYDLMSGRRIGR